jgi:hypothetical protein
VLEKKKKKKSRRMTTGHVACIDEIGNAYRILVATLNGRQPT